MLIQKFEEQVKKGPGKIAVKEIEKTFTYDRLNRYAISSAHVIRRHQRVNKRNETVGLLLDHGVDMIAAILAVLKTGNIYVPISPGYPLNRIAYMLNHAECSALVTHSKYRETAKKLLQKTGVDYLFIDETTDLVPAEETLQHKPETANGQDPAYIMYTSGSTGRPKGVILNHKNVYYYIRNWVERFSITGSDRMTLFSSFCHDGSVQDMFAALLTGAALYPYDMKNRGDNRNSIELSELLINERITIWHSVPSLYSYFVNSLDRDIRFPHLRFILLGGEPLRRHDIDMFNRNFPNSILANVYGQTESSVNSTWLIRPGDPVNKMIIGDPPDHTRIFLIADNGKEVDPFETGEIVVASPHISPGYWKDEEAGKGPFSLDPELGRLYWTGDLGRLLLDGAIEFIGRRDLQVKVRGYRIELKEIETHLLKHEAIRETAVVAKESEPDNTHLYAYIVSDLELDVSELRDHLAAELPDYMIPSYFIRLDKLPLTGSGKIHRKALLGLDKDPLKLKTTYVAPEPGIEKIIADTWKEVLKVAEVGIHDNFFDLGGNSLDIFTINSMLKKALNINIPMVKMFKFPTVHSLAHYLNHGERDENSPRKEMKRSAEILRGRNSLKEMNRRRREVSR